MNTFFIAILLIIVSGIFQGSYGLGMKRYSPLSWEAFWILFSILSMFVVPLIWINCVVPDPVTALMNTNSSDAIIAIAMGALWGIGAILWGLSVVKIGMSLTYGIGMSITAISGSAGMMFQIDNISSKPFFPFMLIGTLIMLIGVAIVTYSGLIRERSIKVNNDCIEKKNDNRFVIAVIGIVLSGIFSGLLNIGFNRVFSVAQAAINQGASPANASLVQWLYVFVGGFIVQFIYALYLLIKNKSYVTYYATGVSKAYLITILTAIIWFAALGLYGQGATMMGELGSVIGWTMFICLSLVVSNLWGIGTGEWKTSSRALKFLYLGVFVLVISSIILGFSNSL